MIMTITQKNKYDKKDFIKEKYWQIKRNNRIFTNEKALKYKL